MKAVKKIFSFLIRFGISIILLFLLFRFQKIDIHDLILSIRHSDKLMLLLAFLTLFLNYVLCFFRWKMLLNAIGVYPPLKKMIVSYSGGVFFNAFLPSTVGGDVVRSLDLAVHTKKTKEVVASVFLDRLSGYIGLVILTLIALFFGWRIIENKSVLSAIAVITGILIVILLVLFNNFIFSKVNKLLDSSKAGRIREALKDLHEEIYYFRGHKKVIAYNILISFVIQAIGPITSYMISLALGLKVDILYFFIFLPIIGAITLLPIAIGGLGLRENMFVLFFRIAGVKDNLSVAISILGFSFIVIYAALGGLIYVLTIRRRRV